MKEKCDIEFVDLFLQIGYFLGYIPVFIVRVCIAFIAFEFLVCIPELVRVCIPVIACTACVTACVCIASLSVVGGLVGGVFVRIYHFSEERSNLIFI